MRARSLAASYVGLEVAQLTYTTAFTMRFGRGPRFFPSAVVPGIEVLEERWVAIRDEYEAAVRRSPFPSIQEIERTQRRLNRDTGWRVALLRLYGREVDHQEARFPATLEAVRSVPGIVTAFFSMLEPGKEIPLHPGHHKGIIRVHLPLLVPAGDCAIEIGGVRTSWEPGVLVLFDDTYWHRVWNRTDEPRVVLFLDVVRPAPTRSFERANAAVLDMLGRSSRTSGAIGRAARASVAEDGLAR